MSKAKILDQVIKTSAAMDSVYSAVAKCISPNEGKRTDERNTEPKYPSANEKRK